jgi:chemotaxis protein histidine kinase CheA
MQQLAAAGGTDATSGPLGSSTETPEGGQTQSATPCSPPHKLVFYASEVAVLLGRHRYKAREHALLRCVATLPRKHKSGKIEPTDPTVVQAMVRIQQDRVALQEVSLLKSTVKALCADKALSASAETLEALQASAQESAAKLQAAAAERERVAAAAEQAARTAAEAAAQKAREAEDHKRATLVKKAMPHAEVSEVCAALDAEQRGEASETQQQVVQELRQAVPRLDKKVKHARRRAEKEAEPEVRRLERCSKRSRDDAVQMQARHETIAHIATVPAALEQLVAQEVQKQRGKQEEQAVLHTTEAAHNTHITNRNERGGSYDHKDFRIVGYCDGFMEAENRVIEVKKRRNWFRVPPDYDLVQLRVYMRMFGAASGLLVESQLNGSMHRETVVDDSDEEWMAICDGLSAVAKELHEASSDTIRAWAECIA